MISKEHREAIHNEFQDIAKLMRKGETPESKVYYYSACYGMTNRILNLEYDPQLNLIDLILNGTYNLLHGRLSQPDPSYPLPEEIIDGLPDVIEELAEGIKKGEPLEALYKIVTLSYVVTGNGYWLYASGKLKLP